MSPILSGIHSKEKKILNPWLQKVTHAMIALWCYFSEIYVEQTIKYNAHAKSGMSYEQIGNQRFL